MLRTPLKNSKNVSKPFKSPFENRTQSKEDKSSVEKLKKDDEKLCSPLPSRNLVTKRVLQLEDDHYKVVKKPKLEKYEIEQLQGEVPAKLTKRDMLMLKKKVFEVRQELERLKSRERCAKKNNPEELKESINKWRTACQNALEMFCSELKEQKGESYKMADILKMLGIPETLVNYSEKDDSFT